MTLAKYRRKSRVRRALCHLIPFVVAACVGATAIMVLDRNLPQEVIWGKIVPPTVLPGQPVTFHFGLRKFTEYGGVVTRWVTDANGQIFNLIPTPTVNDQVKDRGAEVEITKAFNVPCGMAVGDAKYHSITYLHSWWNLVQRVFPVQHEVVYPFTVKAGRYDNACSLTGGGQGIQGEPGEQGKTGPQGRAGENAPAPK